MYLVSTLLMQYTVTMLTHFWPCTKGQANLVSKTCKTMMRYVFKMGVCNVISMDQLVEDS